MTDFESIAPNVGDVENAYEKILDVYDGPIADLKEGGTVDEEKWVNVPEISAFNPVFTPTTQTVSNYAYKGQPGTSKIGSTFQVDFTTTKRRNPATGNWYPDYLLLKQHADAKGEANKIGFRYYDALGADDAYQGIALVGNPVRQNTGDTDSGVDQFTFTGDGEVVPIDNPVNPKIQVASVDLGSAISMAVGATKKITATVEPDNATDKTVTYGSSDTTVATVASDGTVTGKKAGTATITGTAANGVSGTVKATVTAA